MPRKLRVAVISGIWPPVVGGPATHAPKIGEFLAARGHTVRAVTSGGSETVLPTAFSLDVVPLQRPLPFRLVAGFRAISQAVRWADVVYSTGMYTRSAAAARVLRRPIVVRLTSDPAFERARSRGLFAGDLRSFQGADGVQISLLKILRSRVASGATRVITPSAYLGELVRHWSRAPIQPVVVPNPSPTIAPSAPRDELRSELGIAGPTILFAGRLVQQKNLPLLLEALEELPDASLVVLGDGPEGSGLEARSREPQLAGRVRFLGAQQPEAVLDWMRAVDCVALPSDWENHPHAVVEAVAVGVPVVATNVGGVSEIMRHDGDGLLVPRGASGAFRDALERVLSGAWAPDPGAAVRAAGEALSEEQAFGRVEKLLEEASCLRPTAT